MSTEARKELAAIIQREYVRAIDRRRPTDAYDAPADAIIAAGYIKPDLLTDEAVIEKVADLLAYFRVQDSNPKADHPRVGYYAFSDDQRAHLRDRQLSNARTILTALCEQVS